MSVDLPRLSRDLSSGPGDPERPPGRWLRALQGVVAVRPGEVVAMLWSAALFFTVLASYYLIRPLRDAMGITGGVKSLQWMFTATFVAMLLAVPMFAAVVARWPRQVFMPWVFRGFALQLLAFFVVMRLDLAEVVVAQVFYVWAAVFSLFVVSVFWEYMADLWRREQAERLYGFIAAGGTAGALVGPAVAGVLGTRVDTAWLVALSLLGLEFAALCVRRLGRAAAAAAGPGRAVPVGAIGGGLFAGFTLVLDSPRLRAICGYVLLLSLTGTFLYLEQMTLVEAAIADPGERTALFAYIDLAVNTTTIVLQTVVLGRLLPRIGLGWTLAVLPIVSLAAFLALGMTPLLAVVVVGQVARRAADYALSKPAREVLFTQVGREAKYKAKSFIDTAVYRGGDALGAWAFRGAAGLGLGLSGLALLIAPFAALWIAAGFRLGRASERRDMSKESD
jgi:AAA family ATP:ADP antiporter